QSPLSDLHALAAEVGIEGYRKLRREELIDALAGGGGSPRERDSEPAPPADAERSAPRRRGRRGGSRRRRGDEESGADAEDAVTDEDASPDQLEAEAERAIE